MTERFISKYTETGNVPEIHRVEQIIADVINDLQYHANVDLSKNDPKNGVYAFQPQEKVLGSEANFTPVSERVLEGIVQALIKDLTKENILAQVTIESDLNDARYIVIREVGHNPSETTTSVDDA